MRERCGPEVEILAATKYVVAEEMEALAEAGVELVGENRLQDLEAKRERYGDALRLGLHRQPPEPQGQADPAAGAADPLGRDRLGARAARAPRRTPETEVLVEVNVAGEQGKGGVAPAALGEFIARCPVRVAGLMTMPPFTTDPEASRPHFARLAELAAEHGLERLSMGTSQDWEVAVDEGATIVRLGTSLYR